MLKDKFGRRIDYLRLAITDRCNLRCRYCMPEEGIDFSSRSELLSYEEILYLSRIFSELGVTKVRFTGGEPFVRKDIDQLIHQMCDTFDNVHITTNATLLHHYFEQLAPLTIKGLNISIDSLDRNRFVMITRRDQFDIVMANILACKHHGLPVKINMVVMKGINDMEVVDFINFGIAHDIEVRFIEAMPFNADDGNKDQFIPAPQILEIVQASFPSVQPMIDKAPSSSMKYLIDNSYKFGIIPAYSRSLCGSCNRIRLTPQGDLLTCLYAVNGVNIRDLLRDPLSTKESIKLAIIDAVSKKEKDGYVEEQKRDSQIFNSMTTIGG